MESEPSEGAPAGALQNDVAPDAPAEAPPTPAVIDIADLDWEAIRASVIARRANPQVAGLVETFASPPAMMFDEFRAGPDDRAIHVTAMDEAAPLWIIGDLHGDLLALETALALVARESPEAPARIIFLGDFFDDGGDAVPVLLRVLELVLASPERVAIICGNHEEALGHDGERFTATVAPSDFCDMLNVRLHDASLVALGLLVIRLSARLPRALFLPDGLLVTHGGFPLTDLHAELHATSAWNDERCLADFTWTRAHPRARKKIPNRVSRGSQFGYEDFAAFCDLAGSLGRPVTRMVRGHDHVDERFEIYPSYAATPVLTTVALSRRLPRELLGPHARVPTIARWMRGTLPQVHRLHVPEALVQELYPEIIETTEGASE